MAETPTPPPLHLEAVSGKGNQPDLCGQVALVTGASRGVGKGCALALAKAGCIVYITGRTSRETEGYWGNLEDSAAEIAQEAKRSCQGGDCKAFHCDHTDDHETEAVFKKIDKLQDNRLDILVNNACYMSCVPQEGKYWWEREGMKHWDSVTNAGLRSHYMCSLLAARRMAARGQGLIVSISSPGGMLPEATTVDGLSHRPSHASIPFVVARSATDRMMADMATDLQSVGVAAMSLWPGRALTERNVGLRDAQALRSTGKYETPEFIGRAVVALAGDERVLSKAGKIVMPHELALEYGFTDTDGTIPRDELGIIPLRGQMKSPPEYWVPDWDGYQKP